MQGIVLIGMPCSGKSTLGKRVAEILNFKFFDGDAEIEKKYNDRQEFLNTYGDKAYVKMEAEIIRDLPSDNSVMAPGGSVVYSKDAMQYLKRFFKVFLDVPLETIKYRLINNKIIDKRGIVRLNKLGIENLYAERKKLYNKYADFVINGGYGQEKLANSIVNAYAMNKLTKKKNSMSYISTNGKSKANFNEALMQGLASDKGLFVPEYIPKLSQEEMNFMKYLKYHELAFIIMRRFVDIEDLTLKRICEEAYSFDIPIECYDNGKLFIARLDQGPSASFKDFGVQLLAHIMEYILSKENKKITILTATSGDTGGAVASAFHNIKNIQVIILMPADEITERQRKQMTTLGRNINAVLVNGKFDDCQALAKEALAKIEGLSSANSINIGRLLPQIVYYFYIYCRIKADTFVVPSGNFGNLVAGLMAKKMGLLIRLVAAVNENDEVPRFFESAIYKPITPSKRCISNAMNIGNPSNLARLVWLYGGVMDEKGQVVKLPDMEKIMADIDSISITDAETISAIKSAYKRGIILEPHGAVGFAAIEELKHTKDLGVVALLETAHPAKFPEEFDKLGINYSIPDGLAKLDNLEEYYTKINPDFDKIYKLIKDFST